LDHVVYLDARSNELENLLAGKKTMLIRGGTGRKIPHGRVDKGDILYFINNNGEGTIRAKAEVSLAIHSEKMSTEDSISLVRQYQPELCLSEKQFARWAGKRYVVLIGVASIEEIPPFAIDKRSFKNMDDWLLVGTMETVLN
jgi:hypothetical protein